VRHHPSEESPPPIFICGPTASGKTAAAIEIAQQLDGEIINADAYQIYRDLDIITAAPSAHERAQAPHHLYNILSPTEDFDAQRYLEHAEPIIKEIQSRGKVAIITGGSGMYLKFLTHGPSNIPAGDDTLRAELEAFTDDELVHKLKALDPKGAAQTNLKNRRYVIRALEICILSGKPMSQVKSDWKRNNTETEKHLRGILLQWDRDELRERIKIRTQTMLRSGAIEEVASQPSFSKTCEKAIGIRQIQSLLKNEITKERCEELIYFATCQYAKRQRTWFQKESWIKSLYIDRKENYKLLIYKYLLEYLRD